MFKYQRGEVYLAQEIQTQPNEGILKTRLWVLVGATPVNAARSTVVAAPLSTHAKEIAGLSIPVNIHQTVFFVILDQLRAVDKKRFMRCESALSADEMSLIDDGLRQVLTL